MSTANDTCAGELEVRPHERLVLVSGNPVPLSSKELAIFTMLAEHPGWVFSADQLAHDSDETGCSPDSVSVLVYRLRQKLAEAGVTDVVQTVRGLGYRMRPTAAETGDQSADGDGPGRELRDACWQLQEAVIDVEHSGSLDQQHAVAELLERARRDVYLSLAE